MSKENKDKAEEEKIRTVLEGFLREVAVNELCRREGIKPGAFYAWTKDFMEAGKERLTRDTVRDATRQEIEQIKRESIDLKHLVADLSPEVYRLKKTVIPLLEDHNGTGKWTLESWANHAYSFGYHSRLGNRIGRSKWSDIFHHRFYLGETWMKLGDIPTKGTHYHRERKAGHEEGTLRFLY